jgi:sialate O-acetylesterase
MTKYFVTAVLLCVTPGYADVRLPKILDSQMVLQRNSEVKLWGWADAGEKIEVRCNWLDERANTTADTEGRWQVRLKTCAAGGPHTITIEGKNQIKLRGVLFGEVWIASGQSNMEMPLIQVSGAYTGIMDAEKEVREADHPNIRLFQVGNFSSNRPLDEVRAGTTIYGVPPAACRWQACTPQTIPTFSSTAYFFARQLHNELQVPIGIIDASWGGASAEDLTPAAGLERLGYDADLEQAENRPQQGDQRIPTRLYNGMIHPLRHLTIRGVIFYQGERNAARADKYRELFSTMIGQWRRAFGYDFSFYFVQIAPFPYPFPEINTAYLREAQFQTMSLHGTGMAVTMDIGNLKDIHPKNKQEVGRRLALWALAKNYGGDIVYSGPVYRQSTVQGEKMRIKFDHVGSGLKTSDNQPPSHFEIAGSDNIFHPAEARIDANDLVVSSPNVSAPKSVRFAFTSEAVPNLINKEGLPASSFRTDQW